MAIHGNRVAVVDGCRIPFQKSGTGYASLMGWQLGQLAVKGLMARTGLSGMDVDQVIMGCVATDIATTNIAREIALGAGIPRTVPAHTCTVACISANQAITNGVALIASGQADAVIAGGVETFSDADIRVSKKYRKFLMDLTLHKRPKTLRGKLSLLKSMRPLDFIVPEYPAMAEYSTGMTMGKDADRLANRLGISRQDQDRYAEMSHGRALEGWASEVLKEEVVPVVVPESGELLSCDNGPRRDADVATLSRLRPAFAKGCGTVTAGNASFLTDGAAAVLLMHEEKALAMGLIPLATVRDFYYSAQDPTEELLLGPAFAIPGVLDRAGISLDEIGVLEVHEAFSAQMIANIRCLASRTFARNHLGRDKAVGRLSLDRLNRNGGSLSLGHPFGATGARLVTTCCRRMVREQSRYGLVAGCAAGAMGSAILMERT
ncbi:acetyl-CoA C-acyltransferase [Desulfoluna spongiiphila]|uniref:acetyl-CoA C-acyltransferase n=1 Tax=Desulfoluna spongiiphila TaxID=419481 RepID=A0A1G5D9V7_9BACT|nr:acetyl-CoA C-acyltransferase [Desulfoluna spongiiphila]SCY11321.1 acetyl-CoA acyltransferase/acetyl-CoA acyltransferase [Desulfoluna spongiiphila]